MPRSSQTSLSGGELDPGLHSHADLAKYRSGVALAENWFVLAQGGMKTRAGFEYISEGLGVARLLPFQFNTEQTYALIFSNLALRVIRDGGVVLESTKTITGATQASPVVISSTAHGYSDGDDVFINDVVGMTELNGRFFRVANKTTNTYELQGEDGTSHTAYTSGGTTGKVYTVTTPYAEADLFRLKYTQSADVMTITHPGYQQRTLSRTGHSAWVLATTTFAASISPPSSFTLTTVGTASGSANKSYRYVVTSVDADGGESVASSIQTTSSVNALSETWGNKLDWASVTDAEYYNVYKEFSRNSGIFGWVGESDSTIFEDYNYGPDMSVTPPIAKNPFNSSDNYPSCSSYHNQRLVFAATNNNPQTVYGTRIAAFNNMNVSRPTRADDAFEATIVSRQVNEIRHLLSLDELLVFTSGGEWQLVSDDGKSLTPATAKFTSQGYRGCSHVPPLVIGETALYVQEKGARIRDLKYTFETDRYSGNDISVLARHLFEGHEIVDWCYAQEPYSIVWAVRDDGVLLSLTYLAEHNIYAWARHTTQGSFESITAISEGDEDAVYVVVKRNINGADVRYVERMKSRMFPSAEDSFCVDSGLTYSGAATSTITGLDHLEGAAVVALADGNVVENLVVSSGAITLPNPAEKVHIGLQYNCDIQSLELSFQGEVLQSRKKQVSRVALRVLESRGLSVGGDSQSLYEIKERTPAMAYGNIPLQTGEERMEIQPNWTDTGQVYIRQHYPLPATILAIVPELSVGT